MNSPAAPCESRVRVQGDQVNLAAAHAVIALQQVQSSSLEEPCRQRLRPFAFHTVSLRHAKTRSSKSGSEGLDLISRSTFEMLLETLFGAAGEVLDGIAGERDQSDVTDNQNDQLERHKNLYLLGKYITKLPIKRKKPAK
jgi:hypothetical protein